MKSLFAILGLAVLLVACGAADANTAIDEPLAPLNDQEVAQEISDIEDIEATLAELDGLEDELNFDELNSLDEDLSFE